MLHGRTTFSKFIIEEQRRMAQPDPQLTALLNDVNDGQPDVTNGSPRVDERALAIGPSMANTLGHARHELAPPVAAGGSEHTDDSAHGCATQP